MALTSVCKSLCFGSCCPPRPKQNPQRTPYTGIHANGQEGWTDGATNQARALGRRGVPTCLELGFC